MAVANRGRIEKVFMNVKERLNKTKREDIAKFVVKETAETALGIFLPPLVVRMIKDAFREFSPKEKKESIKEFKGLSDIQFEEISKKLGVSVEYLKDIREIILYSFEELQVEHEQIKELLHRLIEIKTQEVNVPTIQSVLKKEETLEGGFFGKEPIWKDFEEGFIVERKEVNELIKKLENDNIQLVLGESASGKSIILKNMGFKLAKENKDLYFVELKKHSKDEVKRYFDFIPKMKDENQFFVVDDAHLWPAVCEGLVREFKNRKLRTKLVIGSRPTPDIIGERPKEASAFEYLSKTTIHAEDVAEEMIRTFLKRNYCFDDERIKVVSENLEEYKKDLWHLSWALKEYNPEKDLIEEKEIYKKIRDSIRNMGAGAEDVFLPLSAFYMFEIPIERRFLEEQIGIKENKINQLIDLSEIVETEEIGKRRTLSLIHSSIAELYFKTYQNYPDLGRNIKRIFQGDDIQYVLFHQYMMSSAPTDSFDIVHNLRQDDLDRKGGQTLLSKLLEDKGIKNRIIDGIKEEEDLEKIGSFIYNLSFVVSDETGIVKISEEVRSELQDLILGAYVSSDLDLIILSKLEKEKDVEKIGWFMILTDIASKKLAQYFINNLNFHRLLFKLEKEKDVGKIGTCIGGVASASKRIGSIVANGIHFDSLLAKIEKEEDMKKLIECVFSITHADARVGLKLAKSIDFSKIKESEETDMLAESCVNCSSIEVLQEIAIRLNPKVKEELRGFLEYIGCKSF